MRISAQWKFAAFAEEGQGFISEQDLRWTWLYSQHTVATMKPDRLHNGPSIMGP
jgi:hypothetical protein